MESTEIIRIRLDGAEKELLNRLSTELDRLAECTVKMWAERQKHFEVQEKILRSRLSNARSLYEEIQIVRQEIEATKNATPKTPQP